MIIGESGALLSPIPNRGSLLYLFHYSKITEYTIACMVILWRNYSYQMAEMLI